MYKATTALQKIRALDPDKRIWVIQGGTSAGKTIAILLHLIDLAQSKSLSFSTTSESLPHLKRGAMRDFLNVMKTHKYYREEMHNRTDFTYNFETGSYMEFFGADDPTKLRGPRRDVLFINEANNLPFQTFEQLEVRTRDLVIIDYNPVSEFWAHTEIIPKMKHEFLKLTYKDNEALEKSIVESIESRKDKPNWWKVYGLGETGTKEGQIYQEWPQIDRVPEEAVLERRGLDFGYTNHPTAIVAIYRHNDELILDEEAYQSGLTNPQIADKLKLLDNPGTLVVADSAEPKSIDEIKGYGINLIGAVKGTGSVNYGIQTMQDQKIKVTKRSINIIKENRNYLWKLDRDGNPLNVPEKVFDHAMDAARYAVSDIVGKGFDPSRNQARIAW